MSKLSFHEAAYSGINSTHQEEINNSRQPLEISYDRRMKTLKDIVAKRLSELGLGAVEAATRAGLERTYIRDIVEGRKATVRANKIAALATALELSPEELMGLDASAADLNKAPQTPKSNASFPPKYQAFSNQGYIPLMGQAVAGPNGRFIMNGTEVGRLFVPPMLEGVEGAYAVRVYGTSMEPRFRAGETVWINPHEPVRSGDDVVVQVLNGDEGAPDSYIKEFRSQSSKVTRLWQHNPEEGEPNEMTFETNVVFTVHKIVFHATV